MFSWTYYSNKIGTSCTLYLVERGLFDYPCISVHIVGSSSPIELSGGYVVGVSVDEELITDTSRVNGYYFRFCGGSKAIPKSSDSTYSFKYVVGEF